jgi:hypothetical protein
LGALALAHKNISEMPAELRSFFGAYGPQFYDGYCGEPVAWGHPVLKRMDDARWQEASEYGDLQCAHLSGRWFLITKWLTVQEAQEKYGEVKNLELGPRGGFRTATYGDKRFASKRLDPRK